MDDEAVSPVVGVILMVAITVVLAGTLFVIFALFTGDKDVDAAYVVGKADEGDDSWRLVRAPGDQIPAQQIFWRGDSGARYAIGAPATSASDPVPTDWTAVGGAGAWPAGQTYFFCGDAGPLTGWTFQVQERHDDPALLATVRYSLIAPCV